MRRDAWSEVEAAQEVRRAAAAAAVAGPGGLGGVACGGAALPDGWQHHLAVEHIQSARAEAEALTVLAESERARADHAKKLVHALQVEPRIPYALTTTSSHIGTHRRPGHIHHTT